MTRQGGGSAPAWASSSRSRDYPQLVREVVDRASLVLEATNPALEIRRWSRAHRPHILPAGWGRIEGATLGDGMSYPAVRPTTAGDGPVVAGGMADPARWQPPAADQPQMQVTPRCENLQRAGLRGIAPCPPSWRCSDLRRHSGFLCRVPSWMEHHHSGSITSDRSPRHAPEEAPAEAPGQDGRPHRGDR